MGLDAVEIVMGWEESFGIRISNEEAEKLRTPKQSIDLIAEKLGVELQTTATCLSARAFYHLRSAILATSALNRKEMTPRARIRELFRDNRRSAWDAVRAASGFSDLPATNRFSQHHTVADFSNWIVLHSAYKLKRPEEAWSYQEVRDLVRTVVEHVTGVKDFTDDADFVRDIGID